jgi:hypothetical protein
MQMRTSLGLNRGARWSTSGLLVMMMASVAGSQFVKAQSGAQRDLPCPMRTKDPALHPAFYSGQGDVPDSGDPRIDVTTTEIRTDSPTAPGAKLTLEVVRGSTERTRFQWVQIEGPPVEIRDPSRPSIEISIPSGGERLGFLLIAARTDVVRVVRVTVPLEGGPSRSSWGARLSGKVKADAGDDQVGLVGHRVTLNGSRSRPGAGLKARWIQLAGPAVLAPQYQGQFFSFVPASPGLYKFALIVAVEGELSEPDEVSVLVGSPPVPSGTLPPPASTPLSREAPPPPATMEQVLSAALLRVSAGSQLASDVADVMDAIAHRAPLYETFADLQSELSMRLDVVIPREPAARTAWSEGIFSPLSTYTINELLLSGVDVRQSPGLKQPLSVAQQEKVRDHFGKLARAFRASSTMR